MDPSVAAVVGLRIELDLDSCFQKLRRRADHVVDQESDHRASGEVSVVSLSEPNTSTLPPSGSCNIQEPSCSASSRNPITSRKNHTVGSGSSVRVPTQASLMISRYGPLPVAGEPDPQLRRQRSANRVTRPLLCCLWPFVVVPGDPKPAQKRVRV